MTGLQDYVAARLNGWRACGELDAAAWRGLAQHLPFGVTSMRELSQAMAELSQCGDIGLLGSYAINEICHRLLLLTGADDLSQSVRTGTLRLALAITEAESGSDIGAIRTALHADGKVLRGEKVYIANASCADQHIVAVQSRQGAGLPLLSLFLVDARLVEVEDMHGTGAELMRLGRLRIGDVPVAKCRMLGRLGHGFSYLNSVLEFERAVICVLGVQSSGVMLRQLKARLREREVFGSPLAARSFHRITFAEWVSRYRVLRIATDWLIGQVDAGTASKSDVFSLKAETAQYCESLAAYGQHLFGASAWVSEGPFSHAHDDMRWLGLAGGVREVLLSQIADEELGRC